MSRGWYYPRILAAAREEREERERLVTELCSFYYSQIQNATPFATLEEKRTVGNLKKS